MIHVALDLSIHSTGICIADDATKVCTFVRLTDKAYVRDASKGHKFVKALNNASAIANALTKILLPYRSNDIQIGIESVGFGFMHKQTNSVTDLLFEGAIVAYVLRDRFNATVRFIEPTVHKKSFTGKGNAKKDLSIDTMLRLFPQLGWTSDKLDDMADAMSIMTVMLPDIRLYDPRVICI